MVIIKNAICEDKCKLIINKTEHFLKSGRLNSCFDQNRKKDTGLGNKQCFFPRGALYDIPNFA